MFTVLHRTRMGDEHLYTAKTIDVVRGGGLGIEGIFLDRESNDTPMPIDHIVTFAHCINFDTSFAQLGAVSQSQDYVKPKVFIMNEQGRTVATYDL